MSKVKQGEIYKIGNHIIGCGDSTNKDFVSRVVENRKVRAVITDPPYGVAYVEKKEGLLPVTRSKNIIGDHAQTEDEYIRFSCGWIDSIIPHLDAYNTFHIFNAGTMFLALRTAMKISGLHFSQMLIWLKNKQVMGRMDYLPQHELIAYGWYGKHRFERSQSKSLIIHSRPNKSGLHPTQKPIGLLRKLIGNVTKREEYVYDAFLGSGSTAVACEHLGRRCIGVELDPEYVEVILLRLEKLTGEVRKLIT